MISKPGINMDRIFRCHLFLALFCVFIFSGCSLKFKSTTIESNIETFYVGNFKLQASNAPATITQIFAESLKDKITRESRLKYSDEDPHIEFNGAIQAYNVASVAPQPGERTSFNRLTINVNIEYINNLDPKDKWTKTFSHFEDFDTADNLNTVQEELINLIFNQILEDVFNQAFNNW